MSVTEEFPVFTPWDGGLGASLSCTTSTARVALPSVSGGSRTLIVYALSNNGTVPINVVLGNDSVEATTAGLTVHPGTLYIGVWKTSGTATPTHIAGITASGSATLQVSVGGMAR